MVDNEKELVREFLRRNRQRRLRIHVMGDAMLDEYYQVKVHRISPEFPMPIMLSRPGLPDRCPGGAANVAHQLRHFNADHELFCLLDEESESFFWTQRVNAHGSEFSRISLAGGLVPRKRRYLDGKVQVVRWDVESEGYGLIRGDLMKRWHYLLGLFRESSNRADVCIFSDYGKGLFTCGHDHLAGKWGCPTVVDPKDGPLGQWAGCAVFKPNSQESQRLSGFRDWQEQAFYFNKELGCQSVVITQGGRGVTGCCAEPAEFFEHRSHGNFDPESVVGAGDCFCAFFAMAIGHGFTYSEAAWLAWHAGSLYVRSSQNRPLTPAELAVDKLVEPEDLASRDYKLVLANGCFDMLHEGHLHLLRQARAKGDKLAVAVNSDESVRRLKGPGRPIQPAVCRTGVVAALDFVDFVIEFGDDTPLELITKMRPDVLVKGKEYLESEIVGADLVGEVYRAPMIPGVSTTLRLAGC